MTRWRIAILDDYAGIAMRSADWSPILARAEVVVFRAAMTDAQAIAALPSFDAICTVRERTTVSRALLAALPGLRLVTVIGDPPASVDLAAASEHGILVCNARGAAEDRAVTRNATPELAWGLVLATARRMSQQDQAGRRSGWQTTPGTILYGKTMGVVGLAAIGARVAHYAAAFGMDVIAWSQNLTAERAAAAGARLVDRDALFAAADVVSIHLRLGDRTRGLVDAGLLRRMKPTACLVNTSRGPIVDERALVTALREGWIAAAGLDVFDREPLADDHPLRALPNVTLTPHLGYFTSELMEAFYAGTVRTLAAFLDGAPVGVLNPGTRAR